MLVSVIIPALNEAANIGRCVDAAFDGYGDSEVEVLVVDGGSTDGTPERVPPRARLVRSPRGRGVQMNRGAAAATGEVFVFCHADSWLPQGWRDAVIDALALPGASGGAFQLRFVPARGILHLSNLLPFPTHWIIMFGDQAQFMRCATFERVGGYAEIALLEDMEMMRALSRVGRLVRPPGHIRVCTSSRRLLEKGILRQALRNVWYVFRYLYLGATPEQLAAEYRSSREEAAQRAEAVRAAEGTERPRT